MSAPQVGTLTVPEGRTARINSEYAAWWTDVELLAGTYPVTLDRTSTGWVRCAIPAVITHESNAPHFAGVAVGPSRQDRVGAETVYHWSMYEHQAAEVVLAGDAVRLGLELLPGVDAATVTFPCYRGGCEYGGFDHRSPCGGEHFTTELILEGDLR